MSNPDMTEFENMVNKEILLWSLNNPDLIKDCNGKQEIAQAFWQHMIMPMYPTQTALELNE